MTVVLPPLGRRGFVRLSLAIVAAVSGSSLCPPARAQVVVSDSGLPSYTFPIAVPPGIGGMAPKLALTYTSGGNGSVGWGWTLQGVSSITRCAETRAIDGRPGVVKSAPSDKLCLDGQRLIQSDATGVTSPFPQTSDADSLSGSAVREYRLERDAKTRVRAYGIAFDNLAGAGPKYFKVWTESGQVHEYGQSPAAAPTAGALVTPNDQGANAVQAWMLARSLDRAGNAIEYFYQQRYPAWGSRQYNTNGYSHTSELLLSELRYGGNPTAGQAPRFRVAFEYSDRPDDDGDRSEAYQFVYKRVTIQRLDRVRTFIDSTPIRTYKIEYAKGPTTKRSLLASVRECSGDGTAACLPATTFSYSSGSIYYALSTTLTKDEQGQPNGLANTILKLDGSSNSAGALIGDFNGDGRSDILRWSSDPSQNRLFLSSGIGNYRQVPIGTGPGQFNVTDLKLFEASQGYDTGCYQTIVADFDGDGRDDLLRFASASGLTVGGNPNYYGQPSCPGGLTSYLLKSKGDGAFERLTLKEAGTQTPLVLARSIGRMSDPNASYAPGAGWYYYGAFLVGDFDLDGKADILSVKADSTYAYLYPSNSAPEYGYFNCGPAYWWQPPPDPAACGAVLWLGNGDGTFRRSVVWQGNSQMPFIDPKGGRAYVADVDGDTIPDFVYSSRAILYGNGSGGFGTQSAYGGDYFEPNCSGLSARGDFNGDGRSDIYCSTAFPYYPGTWLGGGGTFSAGSGSPPPGGTFPDLAMGTHSLFRTADFDGDGRTDVFVAWNVYGNNFLYRSLGYGYFERFDVSGLPSMPSDAPGTYGVVFVGNFSGAGSGEFLVSNYQPLYTPGNTLITNDKTALFVKTSSTPPDLLTAVTNPAGITTTITYSTLTQTDRYASDHGTSNAAVFPAKEALNRPRLDRSLPSTVTGAVEQTPAMTVVTSLTVDSGVGSARNTTEYAYRGYKVDQLGRGALGFREIRQQSTAPDGVSNITQVRQRLQVYPYTGAASVVETYAAPMSPIGSTQAGTLISRSESIYCDQTAAAGAENTATVSSPCPVTSKIQRPYVRKTVQSGWDLNGTALPVTTTTTTYSGGYPTFVETQTVGASPAGTQTFTSTTLNEYFADSIGGDNWLLGLLKKTTVSKTAPNSLGSITTSAGSAPKASATAGP